MINCLRSEYKKLVCKKEFYVIISLCVLIGIASAITSIASFKIYNFGNIPSAARASMINGDFILGSLYSWVVMPIFIALIFGDVYSTEQSLGCSKIYLVRSSRFDYFFSKAVVIAFISFVVAVLPFVISELLCMLAFPINNGVMDVTLVDAYHNSKISVLGTPVFSNLFYNHRSANNFLLIGFNGLVGINIGLFTYVLTLSYSFKRALVCAVSSSIYIAFVFMSGNGADGKYFLINYLSSATFTSHSIMYFILFNVIVFGICIYGIVNKVYVDRDIL